MSLDWLTVAIISAAAVVIWWGIKRMTIRVDTLIVEVKNLGKSLVYQQGRIKSVEDRLTQVEKRQNNHSDRLRKAEMKQAASENIGGP